MDPNDREQGAERDDHLVEKALGWVVRTVPGVVLGAAVVLIFNDNAALKFGVGLAVLAVGLVANYARRKRGAPIQTFITWASLGLAAISTVMAAFGPAAWQGSAVLGAGLLTTLAVVAADRFEDRADTLRGVSMVALGVLFVWLGVSLALDWDSLGAELIGGFAFAALGVALVGLGAAYVLSSDPLRGAALAWGGVALVWIGIGTLLDGEILPGAALCLAGVASAGFGIAHLIHSDTLRGVTFMGLGMALLGLAIDFANSGDADFTVAAAGSAVALAGLGVAGVGRGVAYVIDSDALGGGALLLGGLAAVGGGVAATAGEVNLLLTVATIAFGVAAVGTGISLLLGSDAGRRARAWWGNFTSTGDEKNPIPRAPSPDVSESPKPNAGSGLVNPPGRKQGPD